MKMTDSEIVIYKHDIILAPVNKKIFTCLFYFCTGAVTLHVVLVLFVGKDLSPVTISSIYRCIIPYMYTIFIHTSQYFIFNEMNLINPATHFSRY